MPSPVRNNDAIHERIALTDQPENLQQLLQQQGWNVDVRNSRGLTLLMRAAEAGRDRTVIELLILGADIEWRTWRIVGSSARGCARNNGHIALADFLDSWDEYMSYKNLGLWKSWVGDEALINGLGAYDQRDFRKAYLLFHLGYTVKHADSTFLLGKLFENAEGVPRDYLQAVKYYRQAIELGCPDVQARINMIHQNIRAEDADVANAIGVMYYNGTDVKQDYERARTWFTKARDLGSANGSFNVGLIYEYGKGVNINPVTAATYYLEAENRGLAIRAATAMIRLVALTADNWYGIAIGYLGANPQYDLARLALGQVLRINPAHAQANFDMGNLYERGNGVRVQINSARLYFQRSLAAGNFLARRHLLKLEHPEITTSARWYQLGENYYAGNNEFIQDLENARACYSLSLGDDRLANEMNHGTCQIDNLRNLATLRYQNLIGLQNQRDLLAQIEDILRNVPEQNEERREGAHPINRAPQLARHGVFAPPRNERQMVFNIGDPERVEQYAEAIRNVDLWHEALEERREGAHPINRAPQLTTHGLFAVRRDERQMVFNIEHPERVDQYAEAIRNVDGWHDALREIN